MKKLISILTLTLFLSACATAVGVTPENATDLPGFWNGLWNGLTFPFAFIGSLFNSDIAIYAVPNNGGWYDFGFFLGVGGMSSGIVSRRD